MKCPLADECKCHNEYSKINELSKNHINCINFAPVQAKNGFMWFCDNFIEEKEQPPICALCGKNLEDEGGGFQYNSNQFFHLKCVRQLALRVKLVYGE